MDDASKEAYKNFEKLRKRVEGQTDEEYEQLCQEIDENREDNKVYSLEGNDWEKTFQNRQKQPMLIVSNRMFNDGRDLVKTAEANGTKLMISVTGYACNDGPNKEAGYPAYEMSQCFGRDQDELNEVIDELREGLVMEYRGIQVQPGV